MNKKSKQITWWIVGVVAFLIFVLLQVPATWLISKFYKNNQALHNVNGNIWQGSADWKKGNLRGSLNWKVRPLDLLLLRVGADVELHSGNTQLSGIMGYGLNKALIVKNLEGQLAPETLKKVADWQWPATAIQFKELDFKYKQEQGFSQVTGQMQWAGGELIYSFAQRQERMNVPAMTGQLADESGQLLLDVRDNREQRMLNIKLDPSLMLDIQLTQRFLMNAPSYEGKAGLDTYVISTRQPLMGGLN